MVQAKMAAEKAEQNAISATSWLQAEGPAHTDTMGKEGEVLGSDQTS